MDTKMRTQIEAIIQRALEEDIEEGDVTTLCTVPPILHVEGQFIAKAAGVIAGLDVVELTFSTLDRSIELIRHADDGHFVEKGSIIAEINGPGQPILSGERLALNFLQRMSGIATMTRQFVEKVRHTKAVMLDTRKTMPGLRILDKWAVKLGGGQNHRFGLYDMVLIKDNHITAAGGITAAVERVREKDRKGLKIEVEVKNLDELKEVLSLNVDQIMLDNMSLEAMIEAVAITAGQVPLEASGNVNLETVVDIAETGIDYISVGALTHSVKALDISLLLSNLGD